MKTGLLTLLLLSLGVPGWRWLMRVRDYNAAQMRGQVASSLGRAAEAAYYFGQAADLAGGPGPTLLLSLAQAQAQAGQQARARATYARLLAPSVPPLLGSAARQQLAVLLARQGQAAQAMGLLRQALRLNPDNTAARFDYEALSQYLAGQRPPAPPVPPGPSPASTTPKPPPQRPDSASQGGTEPRRQPAGQPGATRPEAGSTGPAAAPAPSSAAGAPRPPTPGTAGPAAGGFRLGTGPRRALPSGGGSGSQRGLDQRGAGTAGRGQPPGTETATEADAQLQTQRERLRAMNLSPTQAQQLLDALRASEQQYLQQRPRVRQGPPPAPGQPTW